MFVRCNNAGHWLTAYRLNVDLRHRFDIYKTKPQLIQFFLFAGRARHVNAVLLTFLDQKLLRQENRNNFKESLMIDALHDIKGKTLFC